MESGIEKVGDVVVVPIKNDVLDAGNTGQFKKEMAPIIEKDSKVVFDMSNVTFVDSSGCGALLSCLRQLNGAGGDLKLYGVQKQVQMVFELIRMHRIIEIFNTKEEAIGSFN